MRSSFVSLFAFALAALAAGAALGHGVPMHVGADPAGTLQPQALVTYDAVQSLLTPTPAGTPVIVKGNAAFHPVQGQIPTGTAFDVDVTGSPEHPLALLYWDGTSVGPSPVTVNLTRTGISVDVSPSDTFKHAGTMGAYDGTLDGHSSLTVALPLTASSGGIDAPKGLYAIGFQVTAPGFDRSTTFWGVLNYGVTDPAAVARGLTAISAAVPEPSTAVLAAMSALAVGAVYRKRRVGSAHESRTR